MQNLGKRLTAFAVMFLICLVTVFGNVSTAKATEVTDGVTDTTTDVTTDITTETTEPEDNNIIVILEQTGMASAEAVVQHDFTVDANKGISVLLFVPYPVEGAIGLGNSAGDVYNNCVYPLTESNWVYVESAGVYGITFSEAGVPVGDYSVVFMSNTTTEYVLYVQAEKPEPEISKTKMTLSVGVKETLTVDNTDEKITWKSSKKSVATVNSKGVVTGKKAGNATITATTESGVVLKCKVTVKANKFTETKIKLSDVPYGENLFQVYQASYDSKGNLVLKCRLINNEGGTITALKNLKIKFVTDEGKHIGTYSATTKKINVKDESIKDFTLTIKKDKLKIKKADLRNASYEFKGNIEGYY